MNKQTLLAILFCLTNLPYMLAQNFYPTFPKDETINDNYFGLKLEDPYRNLEDLNRADVKDWLMKQKKLSDSTFSSIKKRDSISKYLDKYLNAATIRGGMPRVCSGKIFFIRRFVKENIFKLMYKPSIQEKEIELFSTEKINTEEKTYSLDYFEPSPNCKYIAFGLAYNSKENATLYTLEINTKRILEKETIERANYGTPFWLNDDKFFYLQLREVSSDNESDGVYEDPILKIHRIGENPTSDICAMSRICNPELNLDKLDWPTAYPVPFNNDIICSTTTGTSTFISIYMFKGKSITDTTKTIKWDLLFDKNLLIKNFAQFKKKLFLTSYKTNPNGTFLLYNMNDLNEKPKIIKETKDEIIEDLIITNKYIYLKLLKNGYNTLLKVDPNTMKLTLIDLPFKGSISFSTNGSINNFYQNSDRLFFSMESWVNEVAVYYFDENTSKVIKTDLRPKGSYIDVSNLQVIETEIKSFDGTMVPLTILHNKNLKLNSNNPTIIEGYGAYGVSLNSAYDPSKLAWINLGGVYAIAHVRGGGEKGEAWYKGGYKSTKSNSWKDFNSCSEYLIQKKYTSSKFIAARGTSSGGITVGRAILEKPNLYGACILEVSALNTVRNDFRSNTMSSVEYGTSKDSVEFTFLHAMDVYHNIKNDIQYPSLIITAGMNDPRVEVWQPAKAAARFQEFSKPNNPPIIFRLSDKGGHSGDQSAKNKYADYYSYLLSYLGNQK